MNDTFKNYAYIYRERLTGIPRYVGKGTGLRAWSHLAKTHNPTFRGWLESNPDASIEIVPATSDDQATSLEIWFIHKFGRKDQNRGPLLNHTDGGEGTKGYRWTPEQRAKIASYAKNRSDTHSKAISQALKGKPLTAECRAKISQSKKGHKLSAETRRRMSESRTGLARPITTCPHCSNIGGNNVMKRWHFDNCREKVHGS